MSSNHENVSDEVAGQIGSAGKQLGRKGSQMAKKKLRKLAKQGAKLAGKALAKAAAYIASALAPVFLPVLGILLVILLLVGITNFVEFDSRPKYQEQQSDPTSTNKVNTSTETVEELSEDNIIEKAFYINYSNNSYYQRIKGQDEIYHITDEKTVNGSPLQDKYGKEEAFKLSPNLLWVLDKYLYGGEFKFPEGFLRPVYTDEDGNLKMLVENEEVVTKSTKYDDDGNIVKNETEEGIWDYGLSPVITYEQFEEKQYYHYQITTKDVWDEEQGKVVQVAIDQDDQLFEEDNVMVEGYPRTVFLIDSVATFMGSAKSQIIFEEKNTGKPAPTREKVKYGTYVHEYQTCEEYTREKLVITVSNTGETKKFIKADVVLEFSNSEEDTTIVKDKATKKTLFKFKGDYTSKTITETDEVCEQHKEEYDLYKYYEGTIYEKIPYYQGNPTFGEKLGDEYLRQYLELFEMYVPNDVLTTTDLSKRIVENKETLQKIVDAYKLAQNNSDVSYSLEIPPGSQAKLISASQYDDLFVKYGSMYGVDPYLLRAMAAQESAGNHDKYANTKRCNVAGCGLMQIEMPGKVTTEVTAWRFKDDNGNDVPPYQDKVRVCSPGGKGDCLDVFNVENNVRVGAMMVAQRLKVFDYNIPVSIQGYNFGEGGIRTVLKLYIEGIGGGRTVDDIIANQSDLGWLPYRLVLHQNPSLVGHSGSTYGDAGYLEKILGYVPEGYVMTFTKPTGEIVYFNSTLDGVEKDEETGVIDSFFSSVGNGLTSIGSSVGKFFTKMWDDMVDLFKDVFMGRIDYLNKTPQKDVVHLDSRLPNIEIDNIILMIMAFEKEDYMTNVDGLSMEEQAQLLFNSVFAFQDGAKTNASDEAGVDGVYTDNYFGGNASSPLKGSDNQEIITSFNKIVNGVYHSGVDVFASYGTNVKAIFTGKILEVGTSSDEHIGHYVKIDHGVTAGGTTMVSVYGRLDPSSTEGLKVGDAVTKEQKIGTVAQAKESTQQYLHFELLSNAQQVDPTYLFSPLYSGDVPATSQGFVSPVNRGQISCYLLCAGYPLSWHDGVDIARLPADKNANYLPTIFAANDGVVIGVERLNSGYGNNVKIKHNVNGKTYITLYGHLDSITPGIQVGTVVKAGQQIGYMGTTGFSTGVHLHYGVYENNYVVRQGIPPLPFLPISSSATGTYVGTEPR